MRNVHSPFLIPLSFVVGNELSKKHLPHCIVTVSSHFLLELPPCPALNDLVDCLEMKEGALFKDVVILGAKLMAGNGDPRLASDLLTTSWLEKIGVGRVSTSPRSLSPPPHLLKTRTSSLLFVSGIFILLLISRLQYTKLK